jgi:hypothetical protein
MSRAVAPRADKTWLRVRLPKTGSAYEMCELAQMAVYHLWNMCIFAQLACYRN